MELGLEKRVAVITGGAAGIGRAAAVEFLKEGAAVAVFGRSEKKIETFLGEMKEAGYEKAVYAEVFDVRDKNRLKQFAANVQERFGSIDVWINNAGVANDKPFLDYTEEEWNTIVGINLEAVWNGIRIVSPYMIRQKKGVIINISSYASVIPSAGGAVYGATKAAVSSLTRTTEAELAPYGIRVLGIVPGMVNTEISHENIKQNKEKLIRNISARRLGEAADLAKPIVFLASDAAAYIAGFDVQITGGKFAVQNTEWAWETKEAP